MSPDLFPTEHLWDVMDRSVLLHPHPLANQQNTYGMSCSTTSTSSSQPTEHLWDVVFYYIHILQPTNRTPMGCRVLLHPHHPANQQNTYGMLCSTTSTSSSQPTRTVRPSQKKLATYHVTVSTCHRVTGFFYVY